MRFFDSGFDSVKESLVCGTKIGTAARSRIVSAAGAGRPRMEIARPCEGLSDDLRAYNFSVSLDQLSVGPVGKQHLGETFDTDRVQNPEPHRRNQRDRQTVPKI